MSFLSQNPDSSRSWSGLRNGAASSYTLIPESITQTELDDSALYWRIEILNLPGEPVFGVDLIGDMIIGRGKQADLDLDNYSAYLEGVSREHVVIRPADNQLTITDLDSTNGTYLDGKPLKTSVITTLHDGASIGLGNMSFQVRIVDHTTLGSLREALTSDAADQIASGIFPKKKLMELFATGHLAPDQAISDDDDPGTLIMHFRKVMRYPGAVSRWMNDKDSNS